MDGPLAIESPAFTAVRSRPKNLGLSSSHRAFDAHETHKYRHSKTTMLSPATGHFRSGTSLAREHVCVHGVIITRYGPRDYMGVSRTNSRSVFAL